MEREAPTSKKTFCVGIARVEPIRLSDDLGSKRQEATYFIYKSVLCSILASCSNDVLCANIPTFCAKDFT